MSTRRIERLEIEGLFGRFNYAIDLKIEKGGVKILTAPNGYGKSTILNIIDSFARGKYSYFSQERFDKINFILSEGVSVSFVREGENVFVDGSAGRVRLSKMIENERRRFRFRRSPHLRRIDSELWRDERTGEVLDEIEEFLRYDYHNELNRYVKSARKEDWLDDIVKSLSVFSISTNRLKSDADWGSRRIGDGVESSLRVNEVAKRVKSNIQKEIMRQFEEGRQLEASFPARLIAALSASSESASVKSVKDAMNSVKEKEVRFVGLG